MKIVRKWEPVFNQKQKDRSGIFKRRALLWVGNRNQVINQVRLNCLEQRWDGLTCKFTHRYAAVRLSYELGLLSRRQVAYLLKNNGNKLDGPDAFDVSSPPTPLRRPRSNIFFPKQNLMARRWQSDSLECPRQILPLTELEKPPRTCWNIFWDGERNANTGSIRPEWLQRPRSSIISLQSHPIQIESQRKMCE